MSDPSSSTLIGEPVDIAIVDYGMGNRRSVEKALEHVGVRASVTSDHERLRAAAGLVVPGVGAFPRAMENLRELGLDALLRERVAAGTPVLGVCLGMQLAFDSSSELGGAAGLGLIPGEIRALPALPLHLPWPADARLRRVCEALKADPAENRTLEDWARASGASARTLARLFRKETGMSFGGWRQQARLLEALGRLASGSPVTTVALDLGYQSPSAFTSMFRRALGTSPTRYFAAESASGLP